MRRLIRSLGVVLLSVAATVLLAGTQTMTPLVALTAAALIMGGTTHPLSVPSDSPDFINSYVNDANNNYIVLTGFCGSDSCTPVAVATPEQFMPVSGTMTFDQSVGQGVTNLDQAINAQPTGTPIVVFGYSQSARIASIEKGNLAAAGSTLPLSFVLIGNPNRPNGGILERFQGLQIPILGVTFDGATPTNTNFQTVDITRQYDGWSDFPNNPLNPLADANAAAGIYYVHGNYQGVSLGNALYQGAYGDTKYYLIPSGRLPLLMPLAQLGVPDPLLAVVDAPLRVLVETGYDRTISPGQPTPAMLLYFPNPVQTGVNFIIAIPTGLDDGAQEAVNIRPFGTPPPDQRSPYGVGGPPVNAGTFGTTSSPAASVPSPATPVTNTQTLAGKPPAPALPLGPQPAARPGPSQPAAPLATTPSIPAAAPPMQKAAPPIEQAAPPKPLTDVALPWAKPAQIPTPATAPAQIPTPAPAPADIPTRELPRAEIPKLAPPKVEVPTQAPIPAELPTPASVPADIPAPAFVPPEIPTALPAPPPVQAPPPFPIPPPLPVPPPLPAPPPMPPILPNLANVLGGFRLPFG